MGGDNGAPEFKDVVGSLDEASPARMFRDHAKLSSMTVEELDERLQEGYRKNLY